MYESFRSCVCVGLDRGQWEHIGMTSFLINRLRVARSKSPSFDERCDRQKLSVLTELLRLYMTIAKLPTCVAYGNCSVCDTLKCPSYFW